MKFGYLQRIVAVLVLLVSMLAISGITSGHSFLLVSTIVRALVMAE
jgi:hypothetical protein